MRKNKKEMNTLVEIKSLVDFNETISEGDKTFQKLMFIYSIATKELKTKIEIIQEESKIFNNYNLISNIDTRIKTPESIIGKMNKKGYNSTYQNMINNINDIAGIRIICPSQKDIFTVRDLITKFPGINIVKEKDYVTHPKKSGYSSYHLIVEIPVNLLADIIYVKVEIQIRTIAMDFWANLEHKARYKPEIKMDNSASKEWEKCAKMLRKLDNQIMILNN